MAPLEDRRATPGRIGRCPWRLCARAAVCLATGLWAATASAQAGLTVLEQRFLDAALPVLAYAQQQQLPIDIVVQPQDAPGTAAVAMAYVDGRCKLVLSMRGNPAAAAALQGLDDALHDAVIEAMTAHEVDHCWRHRSGHWHALPAGFADTVPSATRTELAQWQRDIELTRREEAHADLVALAWTAERNPAHYRDVHAWLLAFRSPTARSDGSDGHHDTRAWVRLAAEPAAFSAGPTPFDAVQGLWLAGLRGAP